MRVVKYEETREGNEQKALTLEAEVFAAQNNTRYGIGQARQPHLHLERERIKGVRGYQINTPRAICRFACCVWCTRAVCARCVHGVHVHVPEARGWN